jgi:hypothetical protein
MPARKPRGPMSATRAPEGAAASAHDRRPRPGPVVWPGYYDDGDGRCLCSWSILGGVRQVKVANSGCPVRHRERERT